MFTIDERLKGLPALREQVVSLYESLNQPHLAVPGRVAGPAKAYIVGLRGPSGFAVFVYLFLPGSNECAVYVPSNRAAKPEQFPLEEAEAQAFTESMGFMMDNLNFRNRPAQEQDRLMKTLPLFQKDPAAVKPGSSPGSKSSISMTLGALGKLFGSFVLTAVVLGGAGCVHVPSEKELIEAQAHYDLAANVMQKDPQSALVEVDRALTLAPQMPEANNLKGVLLHIAFGRPEEAIASYQKALESRPAFSECKVNLGNVYLDQKRYDEAIVVYKEALNDMLYRTPFLAQGNLGWALYMKGDREGAINSIKSAVTLNPKFCLGYRNLGTIYDEGGKTDDACKAFGKFRELCPDVADAYLREGVCLAKKGDLTGAHKLLQGCLDKSTRDAERDDCKRLKDGLGPPPPSTPESGG